jgi:hypothetical protein
VSVCDERLVASYCCKILRSKIRNIAIRYSCMHAAGSWLQDQQRVAAARGLLGPSRNQEK